MKIISRDFRRNLALGLGFALDRRASLAEVRSLIRRLQPRAAASSLRRLGADGDGGYLVPDDLDGVRAVLSPGVSTECGFDRALAESGVDVFMADASVEAPPFGHERFHFLPKFIEPYNSERSITFDAFAAWVDTKHPEGDWMLQMDIEGAEWRVLLDAGAHVLARCRIMVIEFHGLDRLLWASHLPLMRAVFEKLLMRFDVAHIHPNNSSKIARCRDVVIPSIMEFTFHRRDRAAPAGRVGPFPHPMDRDCAPALRHLALPDIWRP